MYHKHRNEITLSIRNKTPKAAKSVCFQSSLEPNRTYEGESLYREFSEFCSRKPAEIESFIKLIEGFILDELKKGNRLDFGLVSFLPRLSGAMKTKDGDPEEQGLFVRGSVKARRKLMESLERHLEPINRHGPRQRIRLYGTSDKEQQHLYNKIHIGETFVALTSSLVSFDPKMEDEGLFLENKRGKVFGKAEMLAAGKYNSYEAVFRGNIPVGNYILIAQTRCGKGPGYDLRRARVKIRVI